MKKWLVIINVGWLMAMGLTTWGVYQHTRDSYRAVGIIDGKIEQKLKFIEDLRKVKKLSSCNDAEKARLVPFFDVKASTLYLVNTESGDFKFCLSE